MSDAVTIPTLETARLRLRAFRADDLELMTRLNADPQVVRYKHPPLDRIDSWRSLAMHLGHWALRGYGMWAAELEAEACMVGWLGLHHPEGWPELELGWTIDPAFWGRGLAPEGAAAVLDFAKATLGRRDLISVIFPRQRRLDSGCGKTRRPPRTPHQDPRHRRLDLSLSGEAAECNLGSVCPRPGHERKQDDSKVLCQQEAMRTGIMRHVWLDDLPGPKKR